MRRPDASRRCCGFITQTLCSFLARALISSPEIPLDFFRMQNDANPMLRTLVLSFLFCVGLRAAPAPVRVHNESLRNELNRAIDRGTEWLSKNQNAEGWWSTTDQPAVTALCLVALNSQKERSDPKFADNFSKG